MTFDEIKALDSANIMPTYGRFEVAIVSGHGAVAADETGKEYIDFGSGIGVNTLGYCDAGWVDAVSKQAATLQHTSNLYYSPVQAELAAKLTSLTGLSRVFFANSGAEANECAIKLARKYSFDKYGNNRSDILTLQNSFHGRTITTISATGQEEFHKFFHPFTGGFRHVPANDFAALESAADSRVCALILETVQGEGGVSPLEAEYIKRAAALCEEKDILLIVDEVQTGIARTGRLFSIAHFDVIPDVITSAKGLAGGLPIGACLCGQRLAGVLGAGTHGSTFGGNPIAAAAAKYVLSTVSKSEFLAEVTKKGEYIKNKLLTIKGVDAVWGLGLMIGADTHKPARELAAGCIKRGAIFLTAKTALRLLPPLNITYGEIDKGMEILEKELNTI
ncbi:MAG: aspartate aminotransferase family protein [Oscillospiraceae bacterium]|jgi:acetylornithine/N-succinyldiaminopimelate aminotransferase|nr:aspartate aminotransferase family protein [Oscillospiraceae bacterium]